MPLKTTRIDWILLAGIVLVGAVLRLWGWEEVSFFNDELSALSRLQYDSFSELIEKGVKPDGHPAGVQVFLYYWTDWFGTGERIVRLPFLLLGLGAIVLAYLLGARWFNPTVGLWVAAFLAVLQYPIYYTLLARPYAMGLFFCLGMAGFATSVLESDAKPSPGNFAGYILMGVLCAYTHYFSLLQAGLIGLAGLFFMRKHNRPGYLLANVAIVLLWLPHLPVFLRQIGMGGIGGWLPPPGLDFLPDYLAYILHFSPSLWIAFMLAVAAGLMFWGKTKRARTPYRMLSLLSFVFPLVIGFCYSLMVAPVLHAGVLFFGFPFLLLFLFSFYPDLSVRMKVILLPLFMIVGVLTLLLERDHFNLMRDRGPEMIVRESMNAYKQLIDKGLSVNFHVNDPYYVDYYLDKYEWHPEVSMYEVTGPGSYQNFREYVHGQEGEFFNLSWANRDLPLAYLGIIREKYPHLQSQHQAFISEYYCFGKSPLPGIDSSGYIFLSKNSFGGLKAFWSNNDSEQTDDSVYSGEAAVRIEDQPYGPTFRLPLQQMAASRHDILLVSVAARLPDSLANPQLVLQIARDSGTVFWKGIHFRDFIPASEKNWSHVHMGMRLRQFDLDDPELSCSVFVWNDQNDSFYLDDFEILILPGNPKLYGLIEPLD